MNQIMSVKQIIGSETLLDYIKKYNLKIDPIIYDVLMR